MSKYAGTTSLTQLQLTALAFIYILSGTSVLTFFHVNPWLGTFQVAATTSLLGNKMRSAHLERVPTAAIVLTIAVLVLISLRLLLTEELIMMAIFGGIDERVVRSPTLLFVRGWFTLRIPPEEIGGRPSAKTTGHSTPACRIDRGRQSGIDRLG